MSIRREYAECSINCDDPQCPYMHTDAFYCIVNDDGKEYGPYRTEAEAIEVNKRHSKNDQR